MTSSISCAIRVGESGLGVAGIQGDLGIETEMNNLKQGPPWKPPSRTSLPSMDHRGRPGRLTSCHQHPLPAAQSLAVGRAGKWEPPHHPLPCHLPQSLMPLPHQHKRLKSWSPHSFIQPCGLQRKCHQQVCWPQLGPRSAQICTVFGECCDSC